MNNTINIKVERDEQQVLQFSIPEITSNSGTTGVALSSAEMFKGFGSENHDLASLLGNPSSESLTLYKSEPMDLDEEEEIQISIPEMYPPGDDTHHQILFPESDQIEQLLSSSYHEPESINVKPQLLPTDVEVDTGDADSSSSYSDSDEDHSSGSHGDESSDKSDEDEPRNGVKNLDQIHSRYPASPQRLAVKYIRQQRRRNQVKQREASEARHELNLENIVQQNIEEYLHRRGFRNHLNRVPMTISKGILASIILPETARINTITFGSAFDPSQMPEEFEKFWKFYTTLKIKMPPHGIELKALLGPILMQFVQTCVMSGFHETGIQLHANFASRILEDDNSPETQQIIAKILTMVSSPLSTVKEEVVQSEHQRFIISSPLFTKLQAFLAKYPLPGLTHILSSKFILQLEQTADANETYLEVPSFGQPTALQEGGDERRTSNHSVALNHSPNSYDNNSEPPKLPPQIDPIVFDKSQKRLRDSNVHSKRRISLAAKAIYRIRNSVEANVPLIRHFSLSGSPICGAFSREVRLLAYGMPHSTINVCFTSQLDLETFRMERKLKQMDALEKRQSCEDSSVEAGNSDRVEEEDLDTLTENVEMINPMVGHEGPVYSLIFHPRTRILFSVGHDATLRAWDLTTFKCRCVYRGHTSPIWCIDMTDTGHMIVTGSMDTTARIWIPEKTSYVRLLVGHYFDVECVKFHPNEAYVATGSLDKSVRMWSIGDGNLVRVFTGSTGGLATIDFHFSGKYIIGGGEDSVIRIWDIAEGETLAVLPSPIGPHGCRQIALCQNMLAAAFEDNTVRIWNLRQLFGGNDKNEDISSSSSPNSESEDENIDNMNSQCQEDEAEDSSEWEKLSSCSISEAELEPLELKIPNALSLPAPKILHSDSSSILKLHYLDSAHVYTLGAQVEKAVDEVMETTEPIPSFPEPISIPPVEQEIEGSTPTLPESVRPLLLGLGITRWPIPVDTLSSDEDDTSSIPELLPLGAKTVKPTISSLTPPT